MTPFLLAWSNLRHQRLRSLISVTGVSFAVVLLFMQLGFLGSVDVAAAQLYEHLDFDLLLISSEYLDLNRPSDFPRERISQARMAGVTAVEPLSVSFSRWRDPRPDVEVRRSWNIQVIGLEPSHLRDIFNGPVGPVFPSPTDEAAAAAALAQLDTVVLDQNSWPEYGGPDERRPGSPAELNGRRVEVVGTCSIGTGFGYNGLLLTSEASFSRATGKPSDRVTFGLVRLAPGASIGEVRAALVQQLPHDIRVVTRGEINKQERLYWNDSTAVGRFFGMAVVVALLVGGVFLYQIMASDIRNHLAEYATLKALGYRSSFLTRLLFAQAFLLGLLGYLPGLGASLAFYALTRNSARIPIAMSVERALAVLAMTLTMCLGSGLLASRKLHSADPADLF